MITAGILQVDSINSELVGDLCVVAAFLGVVQACRESDET